VKRVLGKPSGKAERGVLGKPSGKAERGVVIKVKKS
jgi:hypothetical protein